MKKAIICFLFTISSFIFLDLNYVSASEFMIHNEYIIIEGKELQIYKNNILVDIMPKAKILDLNDSFFLYNKDNSLYLYDLQKSDITFIRKDVYNAKFFINGIIYESDFDANYVCKSPIESVKFRNCYKIYYYDLTTKEEKKLNLLGEDNYLNDVENHNLVFTSIHSKDDNCDSICSFVSIYDYEKEHIFTIKKFDELELKMSGNAFIDDNIVYFESLPDIYLCQYSQIFSYDISDLNFKMITTENNNCFTDNSEIIDVNDKYLIYRSKYKNFENMEYTNHIYSYEDDKHSIVDGKCSQKEIVYVNNNEIICREDDSLLYYPLDDSAPIINSEKVYITLKADKKKLVEKLEYYDNLSNNDNISINVLNDLSIIGEQYIEVQVCDKFNNCNIQEVLVNIIDKDSTPPKIYCDDSIIIKKNEKLSIDEYGYAIDDVDGKLSLKLEGNINVHSKGSYKVLVKAEDTSGNSTYKEIEVIIYDSFNIKYIYFAFVFITLTLIAIIYIFRVKKEY